MLLCIQKERKKKKETVYETLIQTTERAKTYQKHKNKKGNSKSVGQKYIRTKLTKKPLHSNYFTNCLFQNISEMEWAEKSDQNYDWQFSRVPMMNLTRCQFISLSFPLGKNCYSKIEQTFIEKGEQLRRPVNLTESCYWEPTKYTNGTRSLASKVKHPNSGHRKLKKASRKNLTRTKNATTYCYPMLAYSCQQQTQQYHSHWQSRIFFNAFFLCLKKC